MTLVGASGHASSGQGVSQTTDDSRAAPAQRLRGQRGRYSVVAGLARSCGAPGRPVPPRSGASTGRCRRRRASNSSAPALRHAEHSMDRGRRGSYGEISRELVRTTAMGSTSVPARPASPWGRSARTCRYHSPAHHRLTCSARPPAGWSAPATVPPGSTRPSAARTLWCSWPCCFPLPDSSRSAQAWPTSGPGRRRPRTAPPPCWPRPIPPGSCGLGVGYPQQAAAVGREFGHPLAAMHDYLERMAAPTMTPAPAASYPRIVAANGPKMVALAGELADGALPAGMPRAFTVWAREALGPDKLLVVAIVGDHRYGRPRGRRRAQARAAAATSLSRPWYAATISRLGCADRTSPL